ncbi:MAG: T9SS type A sorting domain-containing protein [Flavobacteriales bacterium]|nr:T9SS type A sorting domain-containing protein [Flavobacteriales bacterium]
MKKIYLLFIALISLNLTNTFAESFTITFSGLSYNPPTLNAVVGDEITISAGLSHPLVQVSETDWNNNSNLVLQSGWGIKTNDYTFTITSTDDIYYVCDNHVSAGMKGKIIVSAVTGISDVQVQNLNVFPNPVVNGRFTLSGDKELMEGSKLEIYNNLGQLVRSFPIQRETESFEVPLAIGNYTGVITKNGQAILRKRIVFID